MSVYSEEPFSCNVNSLLMQLPKEVRGIGEEVLQTIACGKKLLSWNDKLQLVIDDRPIPNTNIVDLVQYILYPEREDGTNPPHGLDSFVEELKRVGLEPQWVRNESVIDALNDNEHDWDTTDTDEDSDENDEDEDSVMGDTTASSNKDKPMKWKNLCNDDGEEEEEYDAAVFADEEDQ